MQNRREKDDWSLRWAEGVKDRDWTSQSDDYFAIRGSCAVDGLLSQGALNAPNPLWEWMPWVFQSYWRFGRQRRLRKDASRWLCETIRWILICSWSALSTSSSWLPQSRTTTPTNAIIPRVLHARHALRRSLYRLPMTQLIVESQPPAPKLQLESSSGLDHGDCRARLPRASESEAPVAHPSLRQRIVSKALAFSARGRRTHPHGTSHPLSPRRCS
jgi:hypothetical protein